MNDEEIDALMERKLSRLRIQGDKEIGVIGRWPDFSLRVRTTPVQQPGNPFGAGISDPAIRFSFQTVTRKVSSVWKWGLWTGILYDTFDNGSASLSITGLLAPDFSTGLLTIPAYPAKIGLEIAVDWTGANPSVTSTTVVTGTTGSALATTNVEYVSDGATPPTYSQTYARIVLGEAVDDSGKPKITGMKTGDLQLWFTSATGYLTGGGTPQAVPCLYPF